ncbi:MAG: BCD family MFS transporter [Rhodospirillales bacterium]
MTPLGWIGIVRLGLVQAALGAVVVLTTSTMNRVMVVELALPAMVPGALVALHYAMQLLRPRLGHGSDVGGRRTPWIVGGMALLAAGGVGAATASPTPPAAPFVGLALATLAFLAIGVGVGASGTSLLVLMAKRVAPHRRPAAATVTWVLMILGFIVTAAITGRLLDPYSPDRLIAIATGVGIAAVLVTIVAIWGLEGHATDADAPAPRQASASEFRSALAEVWAEPASRGFAIFVFVSMLAYSAQDLILEPWAGLVFAMTPGETTRLSGVQHFGVLLGMIVVGFAGTVVGRRRPGALRGWMIGGCVASAGSLALVGIGGLYGPGWPVRETVFLLGLCNGAYAVAAIGSMMERVGQGQARREGLRMGIWGAAQAVAFGIGGFLGTMAVDAARLVFADPATAYASVFVGEGLMFVAAALMASRLDFTRLGLARAVPRETATHEPAGA